ncbi:hypothetical protein PIB30_020614 [Stylosanthes scabra]|uniref:RNase H type-1 domain-containing protein n=1 Tax=Stylosanthes scabra TaxID=79078 RepID=A0ABU6S929_9FABA|nr:hypothetical protein [Stylosanthes scabra]
MDPWRVEKVLALCRSSARDYSFFFMAQQSSLDPSIRLAWSPPPFDFIKVNCDGSLMAHGYLAEFGCILRNDHGDWIRGCSDSLDAFNLLNLELSSAMEHNDLVSSHQAYSAICKLNGGSAC